MVNYAEYTAQLVALLKKGKKWRWTPECQAAFERLREAFASSLYLAHPCNDLPYVIYSDASCYAISGVLTQVDKDGRTSIISTASRVLTAAERKYITCEQELLAIVHALQKFRIYVYGSKVYQNTDNQVLSFLKRCDTREGPEEGSRRRWTIHYPRGHTLLYWQCRSSSLENVLT
jgi:hypothetical protein